MKLQGTEKIASGQIYTFNAQPKRTTTVENRTNYFLELRLDGAHIIPPWARYTAYTGSATQGLIHVQNEQSGAQRGNAGIYVFNGSGALGMSLLAAGAMYAQKGVIIQ